FFQAEDGIRDRNVTGVQTCALPISDVIYLNSPLINEIPEVMKGLEKELVSMSSQKISIKLSSDVKHSILLGAASYITHRILGMEIGRASCRERVEMSGVEG